MTREKAIEVLDTVISGYLPRLDDDQEFMEEIEQMERFFLDATAD